MERVDVLAPIFEVVHVDVVFAHVVIVVDVGRVTARVVADHLYEKKDEDLFEIHMYVFWR